MSRPGPVRPDVLAAEAMSKRALNRMSFQFAKELRSRNITFNSLSPGIIDTAMKSSWLRGNPEAPCLVASGSLRT
jgi:NAD(P)-dependent dehydrogenase (short-subunit alcohol dehydrogenase family)